jgi:hypothetical protein
MQLIKCREMDLELIEKDYYKLLLREIILYRKQWVTKKVLKMFSIRNKQLLKDFRKWEF